MQRNPSFLFQIEHLHFIAEKTLNFCYLRFSCFRVWWIIFPLIVNFLVLFYEIFYYFEPIHLKRTPLLLKLIFCCRSWLFSCSIPMPCFMLGFLKMWQIRLRHTVKTNITQISTLKMGEYCAINLTLNLCSFSSFCPSSLKFSCFVDYVSLVWINIRY